MQILFILDPLPSLAAYKDTSVAMMRALIRRGHEISVALQSQLYIEQGQVSMSGERITIDAHANLHEPNWWQSLATHERVNIRQFNAVVMRKDPPFDLEYLYATHILDLIEKQGVAVFNRGEAIRNHPEKLAITEFAQFTAPTLVTSNMAHIRAFHHEYQDVIVKPLDGMGGEGIFRLRPNEHNVGAILELLTQHGTQTIMAQRYIPEIKNGDKRILLINGEPMPYCLARIPLAGETRGNLAAGGRGVAQPLTQRDREIAETVGPVLKARGLMLVGLDVIGEYLTEINVTSPTCFVEITQQTDCDVAEHFALALENAVAA